ncbi:MAG: T9SS type A sorting domain-containing protein [Bacteroidota bacterium]|nr:T9SS type A sorting domain-containing protein [Bacteroidota bacterium]MDX5429814.1 T9SS type A sorting domain-containing protein [Bacteroidota bacterium]MDX5468593.1 T9SS type A sorting domain-containing protein [Bacteroidota bacterium]
MSEGHVGGKTGRHSMRLVNSRFSIEAKFFWDERATSLEDQTTRPIQDHIEMGFSGSDGDPDLDSLIRRMYTLPYYPVLFKAAFGDTIITETLMHRALAQFVRSIQSFDSKFDQGLAQVNTVNDLFPNFTTQENAGKALFLAPPNQGGAGCQGCHRAPEFDINPNTGNNGVIHVAGTVDSVDLTNTRSPSLRNVFNPQGILNGPLMHNGEFSSMLDVINHYNANPNDPRNTNLDNRLRGPGGVGTQQLNLTETQKGFIIAFLKTLSGNAVYTDPRWSDPFEPDGSLSLSGLTSYAGVEPQTKPVLYPNPTRNEINIEGNQAIQVVRVFNQKGQMVLTQNGENNPRLQVSLHQAPGIYYVEILFDGGFRHTEKVLLTP